MLEKRRDGHLGHGESLTKCRIIITSKHFIWESAIHGSLRFVFAEQATWWWPTAVESIRMCTM